MFKMLKYEYRRGIFSLFVIFFAINIIKARIDEKKAN